MVSYRIVGQSSPRHESIEKATGVAKYTDDLEIPGMAYAAILRSPYAHARVLRIDGSEAEKVPGFLGTLLPEDVPDTPFNCAGNPPSALLVKDERILTNHPLYAGDRIAAVAALTSGACMEALKKLVVEYEPLTAVFDIEEAIREGAPLIHPELFGSNCFKKVERSVGNVEQGFRESDHLFEETYSTPIVQHVALEPTACICHYTQGQLTIWSTSQTPFQERRILSELLGLPENRVRILKPTMGGGFGSRQQIHNQHVGALLSKKVRRPVKIINTREEEMYASAVRHASLSKMKAGVDREGRLKAFHARIYMNTGAYCTHGPIILAAQSRKFEYRISHYLYEGFCVYTNSPVAGAMRGYGNPQLTFARERMMDKIARTLEIDPVRFRLMNHLEAGERIPTSPVALRSCAIRECVEAGEGKRRKIDRQEAEAEKGKGGREAWGVAFACHTSGPSSNDGMSSCLIMANDDGTVQLITGAVDIGQGCETTLSQILAEELGIDLEDVSISPVDTLFSPYDTGTFASSQVYVGGNAACLAARDLKEKLKILLAASYGVDPKSVLFEKGMFVLPGEGGEESLPFRKAVARVAFSSKGGVLMGSSTFKAEESPPPFAVCWAKVVVDPSGHGVEVRHIIEAVDVGTAINPEVVKGQVEGGIAMGFGYTTMEEIEIDRGARKPVSSDLLHYRVPTAPDMPEIHTCIVESREPTGPWGAKSVGELPVVPVAAAIANAISTATGREINALPLTREFILQKGSSEKGR